MCLLQLACVKLDFLLRSYSNFLQFISASVACVIYKTPGATHRLRLITSFVIKSIFLIVWNNPLHLHNFPIQAKFFSVAMSACAYIPRSLNLIRAW